MNITREFLFEEGKFFPSCHASTVLPLEDGTILCAYFAGTREKDPDVGIFLSRKVSGTWSDPVRVMKISETAHWNPVLMPIDGGVRLIFKVGEEIPEWKSYTSVSYDKGISWSEPELVGGIDGAGPVRNKPLILKDGTYLAPGSTETEDTWTPWVGISFDQGRSYPQTAYIPLERSAFTQPEKAVESAIPVPAMSFKGKGAIQPTLWQTDDGMIHAFMRTTEGWIFRSDSSDLGRTWSTARPTELPNNNSGIDLTRMGDKLYLVLNPVSGNWADRTPISVYAGSVDGTDFEELATLEDMKNDPKITEAGHSRRYTAEFSYPAIVAFNGSLHITYTYLRRQIVYRRIDL